MMLSKKRISLFIILLSVGILIGIMSFLLLYYHTVNINRSYTAMAYDGEDYEQPINVTLNIKKRLYYDDLIDGSISIKGKKYEISNHRVFYNRNQPDNVYDIRDSQRY